MAFCTGWRGLPRDRALSQCCHLQKQRPLPRPHRTPDAISPRAEGIPSAPKSTTANGKPEKGTTEFKGGCIKDNNERDRWDFMKRNCFPGVKKRQCVWTQMERFSGFKKRVHYVVAKIMFS